MVNHNDLQPGTRVVLVRNDPVRGGYHIPGYCFGQHGTLMDGLAPSPRPGIRAYYCRFDMGESWCVLSTMIDLEEGPW